MKKSIYAISKSITIEQMRENAGKVTGSEIRLTAHLREIEKANTANDFIEQSTSRYR